MIRQLQAQRFLFLRLLQSEIFVILARRCCVDRFLRCHCELLASANSFVALFLLRQKRGNLVMICDNSTRFSSLFATFCCSPGLLRKIKSISLAMTISIIHIFQEILLSFGEDGISRYPAGLEIMFMSRLVVVAVEHGRKSEIHLLSF